MLASLALGANKLSVNHGADFFGALALGLHWWNKVGGAVSRLQCQTAAVVIQSFNGDYRPNNRA